MEKSILVLLFFFLMWCSPISLTWVKHLNHSTVINTKIPTRVLGLLQSIELIRDQTRDSGKALLGSLLQQGWVKTNTVSLAHSPRPEVGSWLFPWGEGSNVPGLQSETWLRGFAYHPPPVVVTAGSTCSPCFCSQLFRSGSWAFWPFCIFLSIICPNWACMKLFLVPYSFFVFCWGDVGLGISISAKGLESHLSQTCQLSHAEQLPSSWDICRCVGVCQAPERGHAGQRHLFVHVWFYSHMCYSHPEVIRNQSKWTCSPNRKDSTYLKMKEDQWWAMARLPVSQRLTATEKLPRMATGWTLSWGTVWSLNTTVPLSSSAWSALTSDLWGHYFILHYFTLHDIHPS